MLVQSPTIPIVDLAVDLEVGLHRVGVVTQQAEEAL